MVLSDGPDARGDSVPPAGYLPERELIVVAQPETRLRARGPAVRSLAGDDLTPLGKFLEKESIALEPLFESSEDRLVSRAASLGPEPAGRLRDLSVFYSVRAEDDRLDDLATRIAKQPGIQTAYVKPPSEPSMVTKNSGTSSRTRKKTPTRRTPEDDGDRWWLGERTVTMMEEAPPATPDFTGRQGYLEAAPGGVDAFFAHGLPGGKGAGISVIDIEGAWLFGHEDLGVNQGGVVGGSPTTDLAWRNHGTAVAGEISGDGNAFGITGIAPDAHMQAISIFGSNMGSAKAIRQAADRLDPGDIILIELHRPGPQFNFASRLDQRGYIAIEWWPDDLAAIQYATSLGVIVVEAAGNGAENFDVALYDTRPSNFPNTWLNPLNPANPTSGAVVVGAGAPPPGTHGRDHGPDRSRLGFSNHGARVDAQGCGREVTTTGGRSYDPGDLQGGSDESLWYTDTFSGTSSASPIVVGALACIQGHLEALGQTKLTPATARDILRTTGSPQQDAPGRPATQRIGNRPDLMAAIQALTKATLTSGVAVQYWIELLAYPPGSTASLWLLVDKTWRHLDNPSAEQIDSVQRAFLGAGSSVRAWYTGGEIVGLVVSGS